VLSQTTGLGPAGLDLSQDYRMTLAESAKAIAAAPPASQPGARFVYGGPGFQVAGAVVEAAAGKRWEEVFQEKIGRPLDMKDTYWANLATLVPTKEQLAQTRNPTLQGGAVSTAQDYMQFLAMLAGDGLYEGRRVLSHEAVEAILTDQTANAVMAPSGVAMLDKSHYALGNWCEAWAGARCTRSSSLGAWGVFPWLDRDSGLYGVNFLYEKDKAFSLLGDTQAIVAEVIAANPPARN
jgi:CubicO group peptidase (beta-lactamase class C family)